MSWLQINPQRILGQANNMIYGHFIEHFHRQIYGGIYDPASRFADSDGFRTDVLDALRHIHPPLVRWPGGCFVSSYNWKKAVGPCRTPVFDKAWRVEEPNTFGTDEFIQFCKKIGSQPYICTNAGTGTEEDMSDWVEYCNLVSEGEYARLRIQNGYLQPHNVQIWSVGNENWGAHEIGAKTSEQWGRLVAEACKMMRRVDPRIELTAAALPDMDWTYNLLKSCAPYLNYVSIHEYWDPIWSDNALASYEQCMAYTEHTDDSIRKVKGLLCAMGLENRIKIAFDEWNLRAWYHPNIHTLYQGLTKEEYLYPRDDNDRNSSYTMADAVFTACFLNTCLRNCDIVKIANYAPSVNTRGLLYTHGDGLVKRSTYHVFDLFVNYMEDHLVDHYQPHESRFSVLDKSGTEVSVSAVDIAATCSSDGKRFSISLINKHPAKEEDITFIGLGDAARDFVLHTVNGPSCDSYNDTDRPECVAIRHKQLSTDRTGRIILRLEPHSVNVLTCVLPVAVSLN